MKRGLPHPTLVCPDNEQENKNKREGEDHFDCGIGTGLCVASNETPDQRPRELEITFACS